MGLTFPTGTKIKLNAFFIKFKFFELHLQKQQKISGEAQRGHHLINFTAHFVNKCFIIIIIIKQTDNLKNT